MSAHRSAMDCDKRDSDNADKDDIKPNSGNANK